MGDEVIEWKGIAFYFIIISYSSFLHRNDIACTTIKPTGRAGHGSAFDDDRNCVWIFGGYTTYYPYLSTDGAGSGELVGDLTLMLF